MKSNATLFSVLLLMLFSFTGFAQQTVSGIVKSAETGEPLPSVLVTEKGTDNAVSTNIDGAFDITVSSNATLVFKLFGSSEKEVAVGNNDFLVVELEPNTSELDEVVVTGQGIGINKRRISTTIQSIDSKEIERVPSVQLDQLIQSKLPNAQIRLSSGQPGTASIIRSRGPVSALINTTPVIFIDGVRVDNLNSNPELGIATGGAQSSAIADIPMESIDRIEYIPGGAATTLYGADAANGVLQIFTKRGNGGENNVNFEVQLGAISGTRDFLRFQRTGDILYEPGFMQQYRLGFGGGTRNFNYQFSGSLYQDDSFNDLNTQVRRNMRLSIFSQVTTRLSYSGSVAYSNLEFNRDYNANTAFARFGNLEGGQYGDLDAYTQAETDALQEQLQLEGELTDITEKINRFQFSNNFRYNFSSNLAASFDLGLDYRNSVQREVATNAMQIAKGFFPDGTTDQGYIIDSDRNFAVVSGNLNLQHNATAGDFSFVTLVGGQFFREQDIQQAITALQVTDGSISINNSASQQAEDFYSVLTSYGVYVNENLGYKDKLFLDLGLRLDGNSAFGESVGLIPLPKVGGSYILSEEEFFRNTFDQKTWSTFKLRANYGEASVFPRAFANELTFAAAPYLGGSTFDFQNPGNDELQSEIAKTWEVGADMGFWDNRVRAGVTYYNTTTEGALFTPPANPSSGQRSQLQNVGEISNKGWEVNLGVDVLRSEMHRLTANVSYNYNENLVVSTGGTPEFAVGGFTFLGAFVKEGQPLGYLRGTKGTVNDDGTVDFEQNAFLGTTFAPTFGTFSLVYTYNNKLTVSMAGDYQYGGQGVNVDDVLRYFGGINDEGRIPDEALAEAGSFFDLAGYWVEDANYVKIRNIAVSYDLSGMFDGRLERSSIGISLINPLNFVSSSFDPDVTGAGIDAQGGFGGGGFAFGTESAPRMYVLTLKFGL
ncbi:TonB-dependent receptor domain-containing protein [Phaeocystidibacter luteus]|uniref:TonB-dependent receptor n=1 Tax=Phaeocystidibacter luteus TaxID=911197 RepID=A0A6N6RIS5_9FLAO|nr:TonB-dependent receptor [Phaeocystidibacter luteus]KAB2810278.1 TonB-dependent receptor [Phaeocystidibacter luteus]